MITVAVDLGGSHVACALLVEKQIQAKTTLPIRGNLQQIDFALLLEEVAAAVQRLCEEIAVGMSQVSGLVLGFPGIVNAEGTRVIATNQKFDGACAFDFPVWGQKRLGIRVVLENDARLALMGEHLAGAARGCGDAALITLGTGIGAASILDGKLLRGQSGRAGCLGGHLPVVLHGKLCTCGNVGCAEAEASTWALPEIIRGIEGYAGSPLATHENPDFVSVFACADAGDPVARAVLAHCYAVWSALAVAMLHAYSPEVLLFGGGIMARANDILPVIRRHVTEHAWDMDGSSIRAAQLGPDAAFYGAVTHLREVSCA